VLERSGRRVALTRLGEVLLPHARALIAQLEQAKDETQAHVNAQSGTLRIDRTQSFNAVYLREIICEFLTLYPNTRSNVQELQVPEMEERVLEHAIDLGFSYFPAKHPGIDEHARQASFALSPVVESNNIRTNIEIARDLNLVTIASHHLCHVVHGGRGDPHP
jgi:DNA-binding transcriptional LysR family regulator